ncbi:MAG: hypothetical protein AAFQ17_06965, partial [Pseudomonadota bacterium]
MDSKIARCPDNSQQSATVDLPDQECFTGSVKAEVEGINIARLTLDVVTGPEGVKSAKRVSDNGCTRVPAIRLIRLV